MTTKPLGRWDPPHPEPLRIEALHLTRKDPGQSEPWDCRHSFFAIGRSRYRCCHCGTIVDWGEQEAEP